MNNLASLLEPSEIEKRIRHGRHLLGLLPVQRRQLLGLLLLQRRQLLQGGKFSSRFARE